jgi:uncharacterized SAM-binding protein YcdF (DUF218 family)
MMRYCRGRMRMGAGLILAALLMAWLGGFAWFIHQTTRSAGVPRADGIVALTGGADRIEEALRLLADDQGSRLLISGIGGATELPALTRRVGLDAAPLADRVTLGRTAMSTHGNALETAAWARDNRIRTLIVVTAFYHMPRVLMELRGALPNVALIPHPVGTIRATEPARWPIMRLLVEEYAKYLVVSTGMSGWFSSRAGRA